LDRIALTYSPAGESQKMIAFTTLIPRENISYEESEIENLREERKRHKIRGKYL
jgi:hypothetical protein